MLSYRPLIELALGVAILIVTMAVHGTGMYLTMHRFEINWHKYVREPNALRRQFFFSHLVALMLFTHLAGILVWALTLNAISAFPDLRVAFYFSGETYTTLGYGDVLLPTDWRQLGLFIAMSGLFSFGWTTGVLVAIVGRSYEFQFEHLRSRQAKR